FSSSISSIDIYGPCYIYLSVNLHAWVRLLKHSCNACQATTKDEVMNIQLTKALTIGSQNNDTQSPRAPIPKP
ncbi:3444_t:CDS:2, partial [Gigaspora margarita]